MVCREPLVSTFGLLELIYGPGEFEKTSVDCINYFPYQVSGYLKVQFQIVQLTLNSDLFHDQLVKVAR